MGERIGQLSSCFGVALILAASPITVFGQEDSGNVETSADADAATKAPEATVVVEPPTHMPETLRATLSNIVVLPTTSPAGNEIKGSYEKRTAGLLGGASQGSQWGNISRDIYGVRINFPIRILTWPGAILGGLTGGTKRRIQDFRDRLTENLASAAENPLSNEALASDVFWGLRTVSGLKPKIYALTTPLPNDTEAVLYVDVTDVTINVDGKDAVLTTTASATLRRVSDGAHVYEKVVAYQDRDSLRNWTADDVVLWEQYANFARHYLAREIAAETYSRIADSGVIVPLSTQTVIPIDESSWRASSNSLSPTLAWEHDSTALAGNAQIAYELEIYNAERLVYSAKQLTSNTHTLDVALEECGEYRWSVRPVIRADKSVRYGEWMRYPAPDQKGNGNVGRSASTAPAYTIDFAMVDVSCKRRRKR